MRELMDWIFPHKALTTLAIGVLTMVPIVPKYELVDEGGRGREFYKTTVCKKFPVEDACDTVIDSQFNSS